MRVLVYVRKEPLLTFYQNLAGKVSDNDFYSVSEFKNTGDFWLGKFLYRDNEKIIFEEKEARDIYYRCRFLRKYSFEFSYGIINKMAAGIQEIIHDIKPQIILAPVIDNYTLDIIERLSKINQIPYISICGHFFSGYSRITARGEYNYYPRVVSKEEVEKISNLLLEKTYIPQFHENLKISLKDKYILYARGLIKKYFYFQLAKRIQGDYYNYHYNTYFEGANIKDINKYLTNIDKFFTEVDDIDYSERNVYMPLHVTPEATVDYWCDDAMYGMEYTKSILNIVENSTKDATFIIKEHPAMYMLRNKDFYESLLAYQNVKLIHPLENSNLVLQKTNITFTENGSVGVESLLRNKLVICNSSNYYDKFHPNVHRRVIVNDEDMKISLEDYDNKLFIKDILQGNIKGRLFNNVNILNSDTNTLFEQIRFYANYKTK